MAEQGTETAVEEYNRLIREREALTRRIAQVKPVASAEANAKEMERRAKRDRAKAEKLEAERRAAKAGTAESDVSEREAGEVEGA